MGFGIGSLLGATVKLVTLPAVVVVNAAARETQDFVKELKR
ncbi:hypothetical protein tf_33 [Pseudomonas phage tf]|uniref:Uncharacterized protein n=1 Tax=Pseudomonas phage tf TaxID=1114179 RepID=J7SBP4_9CAUD|nr:hypothetical protein tf_33 [Pseudomonas phage tf]CCL97940.1 hypothetical protein tf_33 [Pseudomonas phage tf]